VDMFRAGIFASTKFFFVTVPGISASCQ